MMEVETVNSKKLADLPNIVIFMPDEMRGDVISDPALTFPNIKRLQDAGAVTFSQNFAVNPVCGPSRCCNFTGQFVHSNAHRSLYQLLQPHETNLFQLLKNRGYEVVWIGRNDLFTDTAIDSSVSEHSGLISILTKKMLKAIPLRIKMRLIKHGLRFLGNRSNKEHLLPILKSLEPYLKQNPYPLEHKFRNSFYFGERTAKQADLDSDTAIIEKAIKFFLRRKSSHVRPFCLFIALNYPHPPYTVEQPYFSQFDRSKIKELIPPVIHGKPQYHHLMRERYGLQNLSKADLIEIRATYYGMIAKLDVHLGRILDILEKTKQNSNTAFLFLADHGDYAGDYGLTEKWPNGMEDCLLHVPLIVKCPQINPVKLKIDNLTQSIDIFPTILELADIHTPYTHFGKSLLSLIRGETESHRDAVYAEGGYDPREPQCFEKPIGIEKNNLTGIYFHKIQIPQEMPETVCRTVMMRTKNRKLVLRSNKNEEDEFYDLETDPHETNNLIKEAHCQSEIQQMKEQILRWYLTTSDNPHWESKRKI